MMKPRQKRGLDVEPTTEDTTTKIKRIETPNIYKPRVAPFIVDAIASLDDESAAVTVSLMAMNARPQAERNRN